MNEKIPMTLLITLALSAATAATMHPSFSSKNILRMVYQAEPFSRPALSDSLNRGSDENRFLMDTGVAYVPISAGQSAPCAAFDGENYLIVWEDRRTFYDNPDIYAARVTSNGVLVDTGGFEISAAPGSQTTPAVTFDGLNYFVVWVDAREQIVNHSEIYGARVSMSGRVLDTAGIPITATLRWQKYTPSVAAGRDRYLVVWTDGRNKVSVRDLNEDVYAARVTLSGVVLDDTGFILGAMPVVPERSGPTVYDGTNFMVCWTNPDSGFGCFGSRIDTSGHILDTIIVATDIDWPAQLALIDSSYLFVWAQGDYIPQNILGRRVSLDGQIQDTTPIVISAEPGYTGVISVTGGDSTYAVVWHDRRSGSWGWLYGARVTRQGVPLDSGGIVICSTGVSTIGAGPVSLVSGSTGFLIAWEYGFQTSHADVYCLRLNRQMGSLDSCYSVVSIAGYDGRSPAAWFDGTNYLVVWSDRRGSDYDIYGTRVSIAGIVLDPSGIAISSAPGDQASPAVSFDGSNYLVVWQDTRDAMRKIYGARVSPNGSVLDPTGFLIGSYYNCTYPCVVFSGQRYLVTWCEYRQQRQYSIVCARVSPEGMLIDTVARTVTQTARAGPAPVTAYYSGYFVTWSDKRRSLTESDVYMARVDYNGILLDSVGIPVSNVPFASEYFPVIAWADSVGLISWSTGSSVRAARIKSSGEVIDPQGLDIWSAPGAGWEGLAALFDGSDYVLAWHEATYSYPRDIKGVRVNRFGQVIDTMTVSTEPGDQSAPTLTGYNEQLLVVYQGFVSVIREQRVNTIRVWGKLEPFSGVEEERETCDAGRMMIGPTIVRGMLNIPLMSGVKHSESTPLFDISGRKVLDLHSGPNDIRRLAPGIYFIRLVVITAPNESLRVRLRRAKQSRF